MHWQLAPEYLLNIFIFGFINKYCLHHKFLFGPDEIRPVFSYEFIFLRLFKCIKRTNIDTYPAEHAKPIINSIGFRLFVTFNLDNFYTVLRTVFFTNAAACALVSGFRAKLCHPQPYKALTSFGNQKSFIRIYYSYWLSKESLKRYF